MTLNIIHSLTYTIYNSCFLYIFYLLCLHYYNQSESVVVHNIQGIGSFVNRKHESDNLIICFPVQGFVIVFYVPLLYVNSLFISGPSFLTSDKISITQKHFFPL